MRAALADYEGTRPRILPEQFSDYRVESGGQGAGTRVHWRFAATSKRVRDQLLDRHRAGAGHPGGVRRELLDGHDLDGARRRTPAAPTVRVRTTWNGAGGIGGFFERTFAPKGLRRVYDEMLRAARRASSPPAERAARGVDSQGTMGR